MNTRVKGRKFEKREEAVWKEFGWETELVRVEARFIGKGRVVAAYRDFFGRYDLIVASPKVGITIFIQVSTESPTASHKNPGPMGFDPPRRGMMRGEDDGIVPVDSIMRGILDMRYAFAGVYELFVQYKREGRGPYKPNRTWWVRTFKAIQFSGRS